MTDALLDDDLRGRLERLAERDDLRTSRHARALLEAVNEREVRDELEAQ